MPTTREEIQKLLDDMTEFKYVGVKYLREIESELEEVNCEAGPHPLVTAAIKKVSARIIFLEIGEVYK